MSKVSTRTLNENLKGKYLPMFRDYIANDLDLEALQVGSNELAVPVLDDEGNEKWLVLTLKVPTGSRDGEEYDGYSLAEEYEIRCREKAEKAKATAEKKAKKIASDMAKRKAKAEEKKG